MFIGPPLGVAHFDAALQTKKVHYTQALRIAYDYGYRLGQNPATTVSQYGAARNSLRHEPDYQIAFSAGWRAGAFVETT